jgi:hypothetical protein
VLSGEAPVGRYTIMLTKPKPQKGSENDKVEEVALSATLPLSPAATPSFSATGYFQVATYRLDKVRLAIELPKTVYLRGEEIKGKVVAKYYYGEPLAKRKVRFGWNNAVGEERETNEKGEFEFTIPTRQFEEDETSACGRAWRKKVHKRVSRLMWPSWACARVFPLCATCTSWARSSMSRSPPPISPVSLHRRLHAQGPQARKDAADRLAEREIQSLAVKTDDKGKATVSLSLPESGEYALRLTGQDANGNPLTSELETRVVGDEDEVRLRVLTDTDTYKLGDTAGVRVLWRGRAPKPVGTEPKVDETKRSRLSSWRW